MIILQDFITYRFNLFRINIFMNIFKSLREEVELSLYQTSNSKAEETIIIYILFLKGILLSCVSIMSNIVATMFEIIIRIFEIHNHWDHNQMIRFISSWGLLCPRINGQFLLEILSSSPSRSFTRSSKYLKSWTSSSNLVVSPNKLIVFFSSHCKIYKMNIV